MLAGGTEFFQKLKRKEVIQMNEALETAATGAITSATGSLEVVLPAALAVAAAFLLYKLIRRGMNRA